VAHEAFVKKAATFIPPLELMQLAMDEHATIIRADFFNSPEHQPLKDAWQGAVLATGLEELASGNLLVRLSSHEQFPDFQVKLGDVVHDFEAVMALNKPLGKVYKGDSAVGPVALGRPDTLPPLDVGPLRKAAEAKARKNYAGKVNLCIYMNYSGSDAEFKAVVAAVLSTANGKFESIWLIARGNKVGAADEGGYFICCVEESPALPRTGAWYEIKRLVGAKP
jgi:hypothetical protein